MTTRINIFNEGPYDVKVEELEKNVLEAITVAKTTILSTAQGLETYIWKEKSVLVSEQ